MLTDRQKNVYNCFLKHYRNGEPYQPRKDFSKIDDALATDICRMSNFFDKFPQIDWNEYFGAPRDLHPDENCPHLGFFLTRAAIKAYNLFKQKQELRKPAQQLEEIKAGMKFIGMFCLKNNIPVDKYLDHREGLMPSWTKHYREHNINPYCIMELGDVLSEIYNLQSDEKELYCKDLVDNIGQIKMEYHSSVEAKTLVREATKKIKIFVENHLKK